MKKVLIVGLYHCDNHGDALLVDSTAYICEQMGWETKKIDFRPDSKKSISYFSYGAISVFSRCFGESNLGYKLKALGWDARCCKHIRNNLKDCSCVIIACGNIKFSFHVVNYLYEAVIKEAKKKNIPVMLSSMSIQQFDESDYRCLRHKTFLNYDNVKMITTRDGERGLEKLKPYISNENIKVDFVGDSAYWLNSVYKKEKKKTSLVGINIMNGEIFKGYSEEISTEEIVHFYISFMEKLEEQGYDYRVFTNGMKEDEAFLDVLVSTYEKAKKKRLPAAKNVDEYLDIVCGFDRILATRMHCAITSFTLGIPVVGIIWDDKLRNYAYSTGQEKVFLTREDLDAENAFSLLFNEAEDINTEKRDMLKQKTYKSIEEFLNDAVDFKN